MLTASVMQTSQGHGMLVKTFVVYRDFFSVIKLRCTTTFLQSPPLCQREP